MRRAMFAIALALPLLAACGDDSGSAADPPATSAAAPATTAAAPETTAAASTTSAASTTAAPAAGLTPGADPEVDAVVQSYSSVFDSTVPFVVKKEFLAEAEALESTVEAYISAADRFGGISLKPTAVTITGEEAAVTYDVYFGTAKQYGDLAGKAVKVGARWMVSRAEFCSFMASARTPCPS